MRRLGSEAVVYNTERQLAHGLSPLAISVWERCDGTSSLAAVATHLGVTEADIDSALDALAGAGLIDRHAAVGRGGSTLGGVIDRRKFLGGAAAGGAALVATVAIPTAAAASSAPAASTFRTAVLATGPYLYYRLDETTGSSAADASGNGRNGAYGSVTLGVTGATSDGDDAIAVPSVNEGNDPVSYGGSVPSSAWSIAAFIKGTYPAGGTGSTAEPLLCMGSGTGTGNVACLNIQASGAIGVDTYASGSSLGTSTLLDGNWHYVVLTWNGTNYALYVDGSLLATSSGGYGGNGTGAYFGFYPLDHSYEGGFTGDLDEATVWNYALTASDVATLYGAR